VIRQDGGVHVVAAPDKLRGTLTASAAAAAIGRAAVAAGHTCDEVPMADGGEGTLDVLGGPNRVTTVTGPLGEPVEASWRLSRRTAVIEMARASGLMLAGGPDGNNPMDATTTGTGELIRAALDAGARRLLVGMGGSASTDGGLGALRALSPPQRLKGTDLIVACDVRTRFVEAAEHFAPQKGASRAQVKLLRRRLERLVGEYLDEFGIDVSEFEGGGAAGGLAGGLATVGGRLQSGFDVVADEVNLLDRLEHAHLVVTAEGFVDVESFHGKVVGGITDLAAELSVPVLAVAGEVYDEVDDRLPTVSLVERFGPERARADTAACIEEAVAEHLAALR
jgi:glycerate 2-kinase